MRRLGWRTVMPGEEVQQTASPEDSTGVNSSPTKSNRSSANSSSRGLGGRALKFQEGSPNKSWKGTGTAIGVIGAALTGTNVGSGGAGGGGSGLAMSNKKMLKIGANVRFRGDVMECDTVVLCGRLQGFVETQRLLVKEGGKFVGDAKVKEADVHGTFEGALESTSKICVRSTGMVTGTVVYKSMSMEDGGEVEGSLRCINKPSRKTEHATAVEDETKAFLAGTGDGNTLPVPAAAASTSWVEEPHATDFRDQRSLSPPWQRRKEDDVERSRSAPAGEGRGANVSPAALTAAVVGEAPPEQSAQPLPSAAAATPAAAAVLVATTATGSSAPGVTAPGVSSTASGREGSGHPAAGFAVKTTSSLSIKWPPATAGPPRRDVTLPAISPSSRPRIAASSPKRSLGSQVQTVAAEASEMFSAEEETSPGPTPSVYASLQPPVVLDTSRNISVADMVGTWPPASPANKAWQRRTESVAPSPTPSPAAAPSSAASSVAIGPKPGLRKTIADGNKLPPAAPTGQRHEYHQSMNSKQVVPSPKKAGGIGRLLGEARRSLGIVSGGVGPGSNGEYQAAVASASGAGEMAKKAGFGGGEVGITAAAIEGRGGQEQQNRSRPNKACEAENCGLEACWGDPRFRPRYCARHKKQGNKLMDPVEQEDGDEAALPEGSPASSERSLSSEASRGGEANKEDAVHIGKTIGVRGGGASGDSGGRGEGGGGLDKDDDDEDLDDDEDEDEGWGNAGADPLVLNGTLGAGRSFALGGGLNSLRTNESPPTLPLPAQQDQPQLKTQPDQLQQDQPQLKTQPDQIQQDQPQLKTQPDQLQQDQPQLKTQPQLQWQQDQPQLKTQQDQRQKHQDQEVDRAMRDAPDGGSAVAAASDLPDVAEVPAASDVPGVAEIPAASNVPGVAEVSAASNVPDVAEVTATEPAYGRSASKKAPAPLKLKPFKSKKRATGNNIADFYAGGGSDLDEDEETSYTNASKNTLQSQNAEIVTHTDDGQLRPQPSHERDQQRFAHLVRVNKIGAPLRGKGLSAVGKRR